MKSTIYIKDWLYLKPYENQQPTDSYYLKISNDVKRALVENGHSSSFREYLDPDQINLLACFLTSYFEDIISESNIWNSFVNAHKRLYQKQVPFYNFEIYYENEINYQDICFLIWYFLNTIQDEHLISPFNNFIYDAAEMVVDIFDKEWEYAPENDYLKTYYRINDVESDYYAVRLLIDKILFKSYLFHTDTFYDLLDRELEVIEKHEDKDSIPVFLNENRDGMIHEAHTGLLSLTGKEWAAEILPNNHPLRNDYLNISKKISGYFFYKGQDQNFIFLEHVASGKKFELIKKSFDYHYGLQETDTLVYIGIVNWRGEWWFSGVHFQTPFHAEIVLAEKNSLESRAALNFLDHQTNDVDELLKKQLEAFKAFNDGSQIAFIPSTEIDSFIKSYMEFFNNSLNLSDREIKEAKERVRQDGFFGGKNEPKDYSEIAETALVFFNPKSGVEIAMAVNSAFPIPNNPFFEEEFSEEHIFRLLMDQSISAELAMYCIDNCKEELPFFNSGDGKLFLNDIDFLLRFFKRKNYHAKPTITYTGLRE